jgi:hypothetical protein
LQWLSQTRAALANEIAAVRLLLAAGNSSRFVKGGGHGFRRKPGISGSVRQFFCRPGIIDLIGFF